MKAAVMEAICEFKWKAYQRYIKVNKNKKIEKNWIKASEVGDCLFQKSFQNIVIIMHFNKI